MYLAIKAEARCIVFLHTKTFSMLSNCLNEELILHVKEKTPKYTHKKTVSLGLCNSACIYQAEENRQTEVFL